MSKRRSAKGKRLLITLVALILSCDCIPVASDARDESLGHLWGQDVLGIEAAPSAMHSDSFGDEHDPDRFKFAPLAAAESGFASPVAQATLVPTVTLRAVSGATITFKTQNGETVNDVRPQPMDLPHLVLYRNGALTDSDERTLVVEVSDIEIPPAGVTVTLELETQHGDPDLSGDANVGARISAGRESRRITNTLGITQTGVTVVFMHEFGATIDSDVGLIPTPTDYFRIHIAVIDLQHPISRPLQTLGAEYAFLMENQWAAPLPDVQEASAGAAPDEMIVYYCDMFPFRKSTYDRSTWLPRKGVADYIGAELLPQMVQAFRDQTDGWEFPWYGAWTSWRRGEDEERLSVALTDGRTWFHGWAPPIGHSGISINVNRARRVYYYETLTDGLMSTFHHELFHNLQRNIDQHKGGHGNVSGEGDAWRFLSEGTAVLASSVGQPRVQFTETSRSRQYIADANSFLGGGGFAAAGLNKSYEEMFPTHAAMYWRFLYERCGGMSTSDGEDPAAGMQVIKGALTALYGQDAADIGSSTDMVGKMPEIMNQALAGATCPFKTHEESLIAFARAIHALRLDGGRCIEPDTPAGCGFYDPNHLYRNPPIDTVTYTGNTIIHSAADQPQPAGIKSSFGMDFVDVILDPSVEGQSLTLEFYGAPRAEAQFNVQLWKLLDSGTDAKAQRLPSQISATQVLAEMNAYGHLFYVIPEISTTEYSRLGLIITRVDPNEGSDPTGQYTIALHPGIERPSGAP